MACLASGKEDQSGSAPALPTVVIGLLPAGPASSQLLLSALCRPTTPTVLFSAFHYNPYKDTGLYLSQLPFSEKVNYFWTNTMRMMPYYQPLPLNWLDAVNTQSNQPIH